MTDKNRDTMISRIIRPVTKGRPRQYGLGCLVWRPVRKCTISLLLLMTFVSSTVLASDIQYSRNGNELLRDCRSALSCQDSISQCPAEDLVSARYCFGLIRGIIDLNVLYTYMLQDKSGLFCAPTEGTGRAISAERGVRIVVKFLNKHPERLHENEVTLSVAAFAKEYPCE